jgi:hypothetical protein
MRKVFNWTWEDIPLTIYLHERTYSILTGVQVFWEDDFGPPLWKSGVAVRKAQELFSPLDVCVVTPLPVL